MHSAVQSNQSAFNNTCTKLIYYILVQAAERMMRETFPEMKMKVLGHAPWGFYKYKYPLSNQSNDAIGAKV